MGKVLILSADRLLKSKEEKALAKAGWQVTTLSKCDDNLVQTGGLDFNVIVVDDTLGGIDNYQTCRQLRKFSKAMIILYFIAAWYFCSGVTSDFPSRYAAMPLAAARAAASVVI
jgi:DNA-binding response OmpR family regulator